MSFDNVVSSFENLDVAMVQAVTLSGGALVQGAISVPALLGAWSTVTNPYISGFEFQSYIAGTAHIADSTGKASALEWATTNGVIQGATYQVRYRAVGTGKVGPWSAWTPITVPDVFVAGTVVNQAPAATDPTIQPGATANPCFYQAADPYFGGAVPTGAFWFDTALGVPYTGAAGVWKIFTFQRFGANFSCQEISRKPVSTVIARAPAPFTWTLLGTADSPLAGFATGKVDTAPSADTVFDLQRDGISVGSVKWASGSTTPTLIKSSDTAFIITDYLDLVTPPNLNGMSGAFGLAVMGMKT